MKIDLMQTELGGVLNRTKLLYDTVAWYNSLDDNVRRMILNWIQQDQLFDKGIDSDGDVIGWYSQLTEILSGGTKKFNTPYTLKDSGEFYRQMFVIVLNDSFVVDSGGADKANGDNLFAKYGENIVGLTDENLAKLREVVRQKYIEYARKSLEID